jgi:RNA polymerase sigma factor (sigma-70 family)
VKADERFEELYRAQYAPVFRTTYLFCRNRAIAEDVTQEAFSRVLARWSRLHGKPWVAGWVTTTALNLARRSLRRRRLFGRDPAEDDNAASSIDLWRAVRSLPLKQQQAVVLRYRMDMSVQDIAQVLGTRESTIRSNLARARQRLKEVLEDGVHATR